MTKSQKLAELNAQFNAPENVNAGLMKVEEWRQRQAAIKALPDPVPAPHLKAAPAPAPRGRILRKPMAEEQRAQLAGFRESLKLACGSLDAEAAIAILNDQAYEKLVWREAFGDAGGFLGRDESRLSHAQIALALAITFHREALDLFSLHRVRRVQLAERIAALEQRPVMRYVGVWSQDRQYNPGECATDGGSVWHCNRSTRDRPGTSEAWTLAVKKGADGNRYRLDSK